MVKKAAAPPGLTCRYCGQPAKETVGKTLIAGAREAKYRHVVPPAGACRRGDPLFEDDVV